MLEAFVKVPLTLAATVIVPDTVEKLEAALFALEAVSTAKSCNVPVPASPVLANAEYV